MGAIFPERKKQCFQALFVENSYVNLAMGFNLHLLTINLFGSILIFQPVVWGLGLV